MKKKYQATIGIGAIVLLVVILHIFGVLRKLEDVLTQFFYSWSQSSYTHESGASSSNSINNKLTDTFDPELVEAVCAIDTAENKLYKEENEELRKQLDFFSKNDYKHVGAEVIGRTVDPLSTVITINRGKRDGIMPSNPVIVGNGVLVGSVIETFDSVSYVRLLTDNQSKVGATLLNESRTIGLVEGGYDIGVQMDFIPQNEVVSPGDIVVTSGLTENMPRGLMIGKVEFVEKQPLEPFQQAVLNPIADLSYITTVSVLITTSTHATY